MQLVQTPPLQGESLRKLMDDWIQQHQDKLVA